MQKITFTNANNDSITLKDTFPYLLQNLSGIGAPNITALIQRGFQQEGVSYYGNLLEPRIISFRAVISSKQRNTLLGMRSEIFKVFNPALEAGVLTYDNGYESYQINCAVYEGPAEILGQGARGPAMQSFDIDLLCPRPAWEGEQMGGPLVGFVGGLTFPITFPITFAQQGEQEDIEYYGTLDAPLKIEVRGPVEAPKIIKVETDEFIEVDMEILTGEKLFIDTTPGAVDVYRQDNEGNVIPAFNYINPASSYFQLTKGVNTLTYTAGSGSPEVYLYWREQFVGV